MRALVLSGGGAKGAFQLGALLRLADMGYTYDVIAGVSVGALNGALVALDRLSDLERIWRTIREEDVHKKYPWWKVALRLLQGKLGAYDNTPLLRLIEREIGPFPPYKVPFYAGFVDLLTGEYRAEMMPDSHRIWASATMPLVWEPAYGLTFRERVFVDGGVRAVSPLADVLKHNPDEIVIINCSSRGPLPLVPPPKRIDEVAQRVLDIMIHDNWTEDINRLLEINAYVDQAGQAGIRLRSPEGKLRKYFRTIIIEPAEDQDLGGTLDFSREAIEWRIRHGYERAGEVAR